MHWHLAHFGIQSRVPRHGQNPLTEIASVKLPRGHKFALDCGQATQAAPATPTTAAALALTLGHVVKGAAAIRFFFFIPLWL